MPCPSCQKARSGIIGTVKAIASGKPSEAAAHIDATASALREKAESLRVRSMLSRHPRS